jgi:hypothetical protein
MSNVKNYVIEDFRGGLSSERKRGPRGCFKFGYGLDIHGQDNVLKCNQALVKDSGSVVVDLPLVMFKGSDEAIYAFGDTGKIYRKSGSNWELKYTDTDGKISGAAEFEANDGADNYVQKIYWATEDKLKAIELSDAGGTWSPSEIGTFDEGHEPHTMRVAAGVLLICDGQLLALVDREEAFNATALRLPSNIKSKSLLDRDDKIIIGAYDAMGDGWIFTWDRFTETWLTKTPTQAGTPNIMRYLEGGVIIQTGYGGVIRFWNREDSYPFKRIKDTEWSYPGAIEEKNGFAMFGINGGEKCGVYSVGKENSNDPIALNLEYVPSHGKMEDVEIGALAKDTNDLYVAWKDGSTYGIDKTDEDTKANGRYEGMEFDNKQPETTKVVENIKIVARTLPTGCKVKPYYRTNRDYNWRAVKRGDGEVEMVAGESIGVFDLEAEGESYEVALDLTSSGNNSPEVLSINNFFRSNEIF